MAMPKIYELDGVDATTSDGLSKAAQILHDATLERAGGFGDYAAKGLVRILRSAARAIRRKDEEIVRLQGGPLEWEHINLAPKHLTVLLGCRAEGFNDRVAFGFWMKNPDHPDGGAWLIIGGQWTPTHWLKGLVVPPVPEG